MSTQAKCPQCGKAPEQARVPADLVMKPGNLEVLGWEPHYGWECQTLRCPNGHEWRGGE